MGEFAVHTQRVRANRPSQHWQVEFMQGQGAEPVLTASIVTAPRRETWSHRISQPPASLPAWEATEPFPNKASLTWMSQYEFRFAEGAPMIGETAADPP